jgi:hypothetical protein
MPVEVVPDASVANVLGSFTTLNLKLRASEAAK